jgi:hypothetical protein
MDFIFMLTRHDRTVDDAVAVVRRVAPLGLRHIGFKDVGTEPVLVHDLVTAIHAAGAVSYMELVATSHESCKASALLARDAGVQRLLGGTAVEKVMGALSGSATQYFPFPGRPHGHPTRLDGTAEDIEADSRRSAAAGCAGCDLLAYRATAADPLALIRAARRGLGSGRQLIVAGDVSSAERIAAVEAAGADAFTIGTALFDAAYVPGEPDLLAQLRQVLADCATA